MTIPIYNLALAPPGRMTPPQIVGSAVEGGRTLSGLTSAADMTGGGLVAVKYSNVQLSNARPDALRYWSWLGAYLSGGVRSIIVPLLVDRVSPLQDGLAPVADVPHATGAVFSTGAGYRVGNVSAWSAAAPLNAGTISFTVAGGATLFGGEWFELVHPTRGSRAYCIVSIDAQTANADGTVTYVVGIKPPLRDLIGAGAAVSFHRPKTRMRLAPGTRVEHEIEKFWQSTSAEISFVESFGNA